MVKWRVAFVLVCLGVSAYGQQTPQTPADIVAKQREEAGSLAGEWLQSPEARTRAWGAYLVLRDRLTERVPDLLALLQDYQVNESAATLSEVDGHDAMLAVLDALIQMRADVPVETAAKLYPEFRAQSMILLARANGDATEPLLRIFRTEQTFDGEWAAAGNLLATRRPSGLAAVVLSGLTVRANILVTTNGAMGMGGSFVCGGGIDEPGSHPNWPEVGTYSMSACDRENGVVLAPGTHPAFYIRSVNSQYHAELTYRCSKKDARDEIRADYLATLLYSEVGFRPIQSHVSHPIRWTSGANYLSELQGFIEEQQNLYRQVQQRLIAAQLLTESEAKSSKPILELTIFDARDSKTTPLPTLPEPGENIAIKSAP